MDPDKVTSIWQILPLTVGTRARHMLLGQGRGTHSSGGRLQMCVALRAAESCWLLSRLFVCLFVFLKRKETESKSKDFCPALCI